MLDKLLNKAKNTIDYLVMLRSKRAVRERIEAAETLRNQYDPRVILVTVPGYPGFLTVPVRHIQWLADGNGRFYGDPYDAWVDSLFGFKGIREGDRLPLAR